MVCTIIYQQIPLLLDMLDVSVEFTLYSLLLELLLTFSFSFNLKYHWESTLVGRGSLSCLITGHRRVMHIPFNVGCFLRACCVPSPILGIRVTKMSRAPALQLSPPGACRKVEETPNVHRTFQFINRDGEVPRDSYGVENDLHREGEGFKDERRHFTRQIVGGGDSHQDSRRSVHLYKGTEATVWHIQPSNSTSLWLECNRQVCHLTSQHLR